MAARAIVARSPSRSGKHRLRLGVAEADVVLDEARAVGGEHQPGVQDTDVRRAGGGEVVEDRLDERGHQLGRLVGHRSRGVGAHPTGVRADVALADALVVLGQRQGDGGGPVAQGDQRALRAGHPLLEEERAGGRADRRDRLVVGVGNGHALAGRQAVELDDDRVTGVLGTTRSLRRGRCSGSGRRPGRGCRGLSPARGHSPSTTRVAPARPSGRSTGCHAWRTRRRRRRPARPRAGDDEVGLLGLRWLEALEGGSSRGHVADTPRRSLAPGRRSR